MTETELVEIRRIVFFVISVSILLFHRVLITDDIQSFNRYKKSVTAASAKGQVWHNSHDLIIELKVVTVDWSGMGDDDLATNRLSS